MAKSNMDVVNEQFLITKRIIEYSFLAWGPSRRKLFQRKDGEKTFQYSLNCAGCFDWQGGFDNHHAMLIIFPVFFDFLDLHVEKILNVVNVSFAEKSAALQARVNESSVESVFLAELYTISAALRNKLLHHDFKRTDQALYFKDRSIKISDIKFLNESIFQYVCYGVNNKSWYEINALYSHFSSIMPDSDSRFISLVKENRDFVTLHGGAQNYGRLHDSKYLREKEMHHRIFDYCCAPLAGSNPDQSILEKYPDQDQEIVFSGLYYFHKMEGDYYLFPSDLIASNRDIRFNDLSPWKYPLPPV